MALKDMFNKKYKTNVWCNNCNTHSEVSVPKGVTLNQFVESGSCPNCGCATLVAGYNQIDEFKKPTRAPEVKLLRVGRRQDLPPIERARVPEPRPSNRPANLPPMRKPEPEPEPDFRLDPNPGVYKTDVDFWTGTKKGERRK